MILVAPSIGTGLVLSLLSALVQETVSTSQAPRACTSWVGNRLDEMSKGVKLLSIRTTEVWLPVPGLVNVTSKQGLQPWPL